MSRMADISVAMAEFVVARLGASTEMATALGVSQGDVTRRIWDAPPGPDADLPYVLVQVVEPRDIGGVGTTEVMAVSDVTVKAVGRAEAMEALSPVTKAVHHALQGVTGTALSGGGAALSSMRQRMVSYTETTDGVEYRHLGGVYQVYAQ